MPFSWMAKKGGQQPNLEHGHGYPRCVARTTTPTNFSTKVRTSPRLFPAYTLFSGTSAPFQLLHTFRCNCCPTGLLQPTAILRFLDVSCLTSHPLYHNPFSCWRWKRFPVVPVWPVPLSRCRPSMVDVRLMIRLLGADPQPGPEIDI